MKKVKIVQIGVKHAHSYENFLSILRQGDIFDFAGVCVLDGEEEEYELKKEKAYGKVPRLNLEDVLSDNTVEAVSIECDEKVSTSFAMRAAKAGKHIFFDKPASQDPAAFKELANYMKAHSLVLVMGYMYRYNPAIKKTLEMVKDGTLGEIYSVEAQMNCTVDDGRRAWFDGLYGGMMYFLGCHLIDLIIQFQGMPEKIVPFNAETKRNGISGEDFGFAVLCYKNGTSFAKTCAIEAGGFLRRNIVVCGTKGTVTLSPPEYYSPEGHMAQMTTVMAGSQYENAGSPKSGPVPEQIGPYNRYDGMTSTFAKAVRKEVEMPYSYDYEVTLTELLYKACNGK